ncbi:hypothetical protein [Sphaerisporangium fuscum]|uniref:hypothetical protein n=1 Tax=Sphaerisporangium fuscum TaxID=2835868 RepID=UPI001BDCA466|nr:hypothetical protein [Sphaerisporangium fuscum]
MDGFFVDYGGVGDLRKDLSELRPAADAFFRDLGELHPHPSEFPEAAGDSMTRMSKHSAEAVTTAGLLRTEHDETTQKVHTASRRYAEAEDAGIAAASAVAVDHDAADRPKLSLWPLAKGSIMSAGTAVASTAGVARAARLGRTSLGTLRMAGGLATVFNLAALTLIWLNYRDVKGWEERALAAGELKESVGAHAESLGGAVRRSGDHLQGETGDALRASMNSRSVASNGVLADAVGELSGYSSAAAEAQRRFNDRVNMVSNALMPISITAAYLLPPLQVAASSIWLGCVLVFRNELKKEFEAAASHLTRTGELVELNDRLRRGATGRPSAVSV